MLGMAKNSSQWKTAWSIENNGFERKTFPILKTKAAIVQIYPFWHVEVFFVELF